MSTTTWKSDQLKLLMVLFLITTTIATHVNGLIPRKLDDTTVTPAPDSGVKCGSCPACNNPCYESPPPPSLPQPPPSLPPPSPPPPPPRPKKPPTPKTPYCPPPPPSSFIYVTGPPGNLYPIDQYYSDAGRKFPVRLPTLLVGCGLVGLLAFW